MRVWIVSGHRDPHGHCGLLLAQPSHHHTARRLANVYAAPAVTPPSALRTEMAEGAVTQFVCGVSSSPGNGEVGCRPKRLNALICWEWVNVMGGGELYAVRDTVRNRRRLSLISRSTLWWQIRSLTAKAGSTINFIIITINKIMEKKITSALNQLLKLS